MALPAKKGGAADLALIFGKGGKTPPPAAGADEPDADEAGGPPDKDTDDKPSTAFTTAIGEAFPDMAGDDERIASLWRAVKACAEGY